MRVIGIGDIVTVWFGEDEESCTTGKVEYAPSQPGDCWVISTDEGLYYMERPLFVYRHNDQAEAKRLMDADGQRQ